MSEPSNSASSTAILLALLLVCSALLYLDWQRRGEIEDLHARIDALTPPAPLRPNAASNMPDTATIELPGTSTVAMPSEAEDVLADVLAGAVAVETGPVAAEGPGEHPLVAAVKEAHTATPAKPPAKPRSRKKE